MLQIVITVPKILTKFFKHLEDGIYEIRIEVGSNIYRIFTFFDDNKLVILLHGFQKKTPIKEIERASSDARISTLRKIIETGLGGKLHISVEL